MGIRIFFFLACIIITGLCRVNVHAQSKRLNIKSYGAKGDGKTDDSPAFDKAVAVLAKAGGVLEIPYGRYYISRPIYVNSNSAGSIQIKGIVKGGNRPVIKSSNFINLIYIEGDAHKPAMDVAVKYVQVEGNNVPYTAKHPYYDVPNSYRIGIGVINCKSVSIEQCVVKNVYGQGIYIGNTLFHDAPVGDRVKKMLLNKNQIFNTWGLNPTPDGGLYDEYGDGIYVNNVASGKITGNIVRNDLRYTRQFGRAGIVLEYNVENVEVVNNTVSGYDRNIHVEEDLGNISILNNKLTGSDFGILIWNSGRRKIGPIYVKDNFVSNENIPSGLSLKTVRNRGERSLISLESDKACRQGSVISGNTLSITGESGLVSDIVLRNLEEGVAISKNSYKPIKLNAKIKPQINLNERKNRVSGNNFPSEMLKK
ncbi:glycoside hydrolase family 55 protein [Chitinophaga sedimenti]|uniref:glycosyl hydrolase family 28-related protein n=1 Tax=Chitinophaga sedimenti TaxID=2033606 RepID=UPI0020044DC4|nr:glycosyl hydrolase family 28-related protein [Chitinophaga sedimenti]MCK7558106.1 glycoside hydrolase family 55 protein [Chitinophaga sedimenti]